MANLLLMVLDNPERLHEVLEAWQRAGVGGVTILDSTGMRRVRDEGVPDDIPLLPSLAEMMRRRETRHRTLFSVVEDEEVLDRAVQATLEIVPVGEPNSGLIFVVPVTRHWGLRRP